MDLFAFVQKNILLVGVCVASGVMLLWPLFTRLGSGAREMSALEAVQLINRRDPIVIDVREPSDFAIGHLPNARNIPAGQLKDRLKELEKVKSRPILVTCASGTRAGSACGVLKKAGFEDVHALKGGVAGWITASLPISRQDKK